MVPGRSSDCVSRREGRDEGRLFAGVVQARTRPARARDLSESEEVCVQRRSMRDRPPWLSPVDADHALPQGSFCVKRVRGRGLAESLCSFCGWAVSLKMAVPLARFFTRSLYDCSS
eukprot:Plantae.Rhodophyta-Palmaria_palmata.ctg18966.p3 GENE.Plantae.Rhodophyta-Palmaria_palmata.ctg18966~~Plantae.Rhodophyta-Palmaria_palmata.ctg18966.p3  ORF type:complete len:116 (-),score=7.25 Plantae.Rhodophyta-Palmaria_palmata.ctg18966:4-351(-)